MKNFTFLSLILLLISSLSCTQDNDDNPVLKNSEKDVTAFEAKSLDNEIMSAKIDAEAGTVVLSVKCSTNPYYITVTPTVSEKAACSLAAGTELDLNNAQKFTVTAEDGSTKEWHVFLQGAFLHYSNYRTANNVYETVDCAVNTDVIKSYYHQVTDKELLLALHLNHSGNIVFTGFYLTGLIHGLPGGLLDLSDNGPFYGSFNPTGNGVGPFNFLLHVDNPSGKLGYSYDEELKLISGTFEFTQGSIVTGHTDHIKGQFFGIPAI